MLAMERGKPGRNYFLAGPVHTIVVALAVARVDHGNTGAAACAMPAAAS